MTGESSVEATGIERARVDRSAGELSWYPGPDMSGPVARWRTVRWIVIVGWLLVAAVTLLGGDRPSSFGHLEQAVAHAHVDRVEVTPGLQKHSTGYAVVEIHWREGALRYHTEVVEARPRRRAPEDVSDDGVTAVLGRDVASVLRDQQPDLAVGHRPVPSMDAEVHGWQLPVWLGFVVTALGLTTLSLLVVGPRPWRATRWAWFWLVAVAFPLGLVPFLLLAGPMPLVRSPRPGARRLTGGWAFLLALILSAALPTLA